MSDNTNDTYVDGDADGTPCLWLINHPTGPELLLSKDDIRIAVNRHKPNAHWGQASRDAHIDRLWDAIAATAAEPAPTDRDRIVAAFVAQREEYVSVLKQCIEDNADYHRWQGHAEARRQLRDKLAAAEPTPEQVEAASAPGVPEFDRERVEASITEAIEDLCISAFPVPYPIDGERPASLPIENVVGHIAGFVRVALLPKEPTS